METLTFATSAQFLKWARMVVKYKLPRYDRVPVGKQIWTYGNGDVIEGTMGKRGGTVLSNLSFVIRTGTGELKHSSDTETVGWIDTKGGVTLQIDWGE